MSVARFTIGGIVVLSALLAAFPLYFKDRKQSIFSPFSSSTSHAKTSAGGSFFSNDDVLGVVDGKEIHFGDLSTKDKQALFEAQSKVYSSVYEALSEKYIQGLVEEYMKENKISDIREGKRLFVQQNASIPKEKVLEFIKQNEQNPALKGKPIEEQINLVTPYLTQQVVGSYLQSLVKTGEDQGLIQVAVEKPQPPVIEIDIKGAPSLGDPSAPITIVEFADYQCPFCNRAQPTLKALLKKYEGKIHFVYKNFPLVSIHPQALPAATAAVCAGQQGKYWEMHDQLFENYDKLSSDLYMSLASTLGLDKNKFTACLNDGSIKNKLMGELEYGENLGVNSTPAFYINGKQLMGALPLEEFTKIIDSELAKKGHGG